MLLIDTDVLIWYMRGNEKARRTVEALDGFCLSVVTYMELIQGMRDKRELYALRQAMRGWKTRIVYLSEEISAKAMFLVEQHFLSHALEMADALIAASALNCGLPILTGNHKHYKVLGGDLEVRKFLP